VCLPLASLVPDASTLIALTLLAAAVFGGWTLARGGGGMALDGLERANRVLEKRVSDLEHENTALTARLADLSGRTDFAAAFTAQLAPLLAWTSGHEQRAQERHEAAVTAQARSTDALLGALEQVAHVIGPENHEHEGAPLGGQA